MLPLLYCEDVLGEFCAVMTVKAFKMSAPYGKETTFECLCTLARLSSACGSLRTSESLQRTISTARQHLVVQLVRHPSWTNRFITSSAGVSLKGIEDTSLSLWNLVRAGDMLHLRQYLAAGFHVNQTRLVHSDQSHESFDQAPHTDGPGTTRELSGMHCAWITQASPEILRLLLVSGADPDVEIMPGDALCYYSAKELKRERFVRDNPLRPSAMLQAAAMTLRNELPMHLCLSLCAQGSLIHVRDKDRGSIGMIPCPPPTPCRPVTETKRHRSASSATRSACSNSIRVDAEIFEAKLHSAHAKQKASLEPTDTGEITHISPFLSSTSSQEISGVCIKWNCSSMLDIGQGLNPNSAGGPAQLPPALHDQLEVILAKNSRRAQERLCEHCDGEELTAKQEATREAMADEQETREGVVGVIGAFQAIPNDVQALMDEIESASASAA